MGAKILIVDDEPNVLRLIGYALQAEGYQIITAKNGIEAMTKVQAEQPDLVILDVMLPELSGIDICRQLRSRSETATLPIIMFSARIQIPDKVAGFKAGADEYLTKPIAPDELVIRVAALLERTKRLLQAGPGRHGKRLGFIGAKGGVGTTTMALNVASALVMEQKKAIALELRPNYGSFSAALRLMPTENLTGLVKLDKSRMTSRELSRYLTKHQSGLQLVFGPQKIADFQPIEADQAELIIEKLSALTDYLVIDLPAQDDAATQAALQQCDTVIVVAEPDAVCTTMAKSTLAMLRTWGISQADIKMVVVKKGSLNLEISALQSYLDCEIIGVIPPAFDLCHTAQAHGQPLVQFRPQDPTARQIIELAALLTGQKEISSVTV